MTECIIENCCEDAEDLENYCSDHLEIGEKYLENNKIKYSDILDLFSDWEGYECSLCEKMLPNDHRDLARHLIHEHKIEVLEID